MSYLLTMLLAFLGLDPSHTEVKVLDDHTFIVDGRTYDVEESMGFDERNDLVEGIEIHQERFSAFYHS
ncbi:hypothetical protein GCM10023185_44680 [Hymenobacter saemangeumensis]|uniref:Uncharacterized protein n=1 Tax=Hymenobacter saemangeumensis TaxID=1084522 RepID=A0ABP8ISB3_9BACT